MGIKINKPIIYLGSNRIKVSSISDFNNKLIKEKLGSLHIHKEKSKSILDIAVKVGKKALYQKKPNLLIFVSQTQDRVFPSGAEELAEKLNLDKNTIVLTLSSGCSGFVQALFLANNILNQNIKSALIVCVEKYSKFIGKKDRKTQVLFSDAGSATMIDFIKDNNLLFNDFGFDGKNSNALCINDNNQLFMNGAKVFNFGINNIPESILKCKKISKIDKYIIHPGSKYMLDSIATKANIANRNLCTSFEVTGNTVSSTIPVIIKKYYHKLKKKRVLLSGFGVGLSWATLLIKWH